MFEGISFRAFQVRLTPTLDPIFLTTAYFNARSNGQTKMLTVGILELIAEVTHHVVPAKEPVAYLEAKVNFLTFFRA